MITPNNSLSQRKALISVINNRRRLIGVQPFNQLLRTSFYIFLFSIPFESVLASSGLFWGISSRSNLWSLSRVTGLILIIALLLSRRPIYSIRLPSVRGFIVYTFLYLIAALVIFFISDYPFSSSLLTTPWLILLFAICCEFFLDPLTRNQSLKVLMVAIGLCALLQINNLALNMSAPMAWGSSSMRIAAFGEDQNFIGAQYAAGIVIAILYFVGILPSNKLQKLTSLFVAVVCLIALIQTGSRSAVICGVMALLAFLLNKQSTNKRIIIWLVSIFSIALLGALIIRDEAFLSRFQETFIYGNTSSRGEIYRASFNEFLASPLIGDGPDRNALVLGSALGGYYSTDTHNTLLWVLTASGLVGFIPFFFGYIMCLIQAFRARNGPDDIAPLVLCGLAIAFSQTAGWHFDKLFWILLAYGSTAIIATPKVKLFKKALHLKRRSDDTKPSYREVRH